MLTVSEWVAQQVDIAPPLRPEQLDNLRALLTLPRDADDHDLSSTTSRPGPTSARSATMPCIGAPTFGCRASTKMPH